MTVEVEPAVIISLQHSEVAELQAFLDVFVRSGTVLPKSVAQLHRDIQSQPVDSLIAERDQLQQENDELKSRFEMIELIAAEVESR